MHNVLAPMLLDSFSGIDYGAVHIKEETREGMSGGRNGEGTLRRHGRQDLVGEDTDWEMLRK